MEIKKNGVTVSDTNDKLIEKEGGITCGCGNPNLKMVAHWDGAKEYGYTYNCSCGNVITTTHKREKADMWY